jgi:hypothetical protein
MTYLIAIVVDNDPRRTRDVAMKGRSVWQVVVSAAAPRCLGGRCEGGMIELKLSIDTRIGSPCSLRKT